MYTVYWLRPGTCQLFIWKLAMYLIITFCRSNNGSQWENCHSLLIAMPPSKGQSTVHSCNSQKLLTTIIPKWHQSTTAKRFCCKVLNCCGLALTHTSNISPLTSNEHMLYIHGVQSYLDRSSWTSLQN